MKTILLFLVMAWAALADPIACTTGTLADWISLGSAGCTTQVGIMPSVVSYSSSSTPASDVMVTIISDTVYYTTLMLSGWDASDGGSVDFSLAWSGALPLVGPSAIATEFEIGARTAVAGGYQFAQTTPFTLNVSMSDVATSDAVINNPGVSFSLQTPTYDPGTGPDLPIFTASATTGPGGEVQPVLILAYIDPLLNPPPPGTPEPSTLGLLAAGLLGFVVLRRHKA